MAAGGVQISGGSISVGVAAGELDRVRTLMESVNANAEKYIASAVNEAARHIKTNAAKAAGDYINLKPSDIKPHFAIKQKATADEMTAIVQIDYKQDPITDFRAKFSKKVGVTATLIKAEGPEVFRHMFRAKFDSGHIGMVQKDIKAGKRFTDQKGSRVGDVVRYRRGGKWRTFKRKTPVQRYRIYEPKGPSIVGVFEKSPTLAADVMADGEEYLMKRLDSKLSYLLGESASAGVEQAV